MSYNDSSLERISTSVLDKAVRPVYLASAAVIRDTCQMDPYADALYLFCGRKRNTLKALCFDQTGFVLCTKRLDNGKFQWPRDASEVRLLEAMTEQQKMHIQSQDARILEQEQTIADLRSLVDELRLLKAGLEETLEEFKRQMFGTKSEKTKTAAALLCE